METDTGLLFDVILPLGTLIAIFAVYSKDILRMIVEGAVSYTHLDVYKRQNSENCQSGLIMSLPVTLASVFREFCTQTEKLSIPKIILTNKILRIKIRIHSKNLGNTYCKSKFWSERYGLSLIHI